jgi:hypothetical protein
MSSPAAEGWLLRTGFAVRAGVGYLLACDPKTEENSPHAKILVIQDGKKFESWVKFNAHSICRIESPEPGVIVLDGEGFYALFGKQVHAGNIFNESLSSPPQPRYGSFRSVASIGGKAYAVGTRGMVYRFDGKAAWTRIDDGVPDSFDAQAIAGFAEDDIYAVGFRGALMHYNGRTWTERSLPTNMNLSAVLCAGDGNVYVAGHRGELIRGRDDTWHSVGSEAVTEDIWGLAWFGESLYASTFRQVLRQVGSQLEIVDFGSDRPRACYHLSAGKDVLWSIGETDVMSFDGKAWKRVT